MRSKITLFTAISLIFLLNACKVEPKPINYGHDHCHHCDMTVVDKTHAAEYVTQKGKAYVFDAIECMVWELKENDNEELMAYKLVANFDKPGELIAATQASYLISEKLKSPMGANLTAFSSVQAAKVSQAKFGGEIYNWEEIKSRLKK